MGEDEGNESKADSEPLLEGQSVTDDLEAEQSDENTSDREETTGQDSS